MAALIEGLASITHAARFALQRSSIHQASQEPPKRRVSLRHGSSVSDMRAYFQQLLECLQAVNYPHTLREIRALMTCRVEEAYQVGKELGRGHFGKVRECRDKYSGAFFACKTVRLAEMKVRDEREEGRDGSG